MRKHVRTAGCASCRTNQAGLWGLWIRTGLRTTGLIGCHHGSTMYVRLRGLNRIAMDLHEATEAGDLDTVRELVDGGADVNAKDDMQYTCLQGAVGGGHAHVTKYLLSKGADPNTVSWDGQTPLMWAATYGGDNSRVVFMLIKKGARVNERDYSQRTALHHAAFNGDPHTARALIINGADQTLRDKYAKTPRELAEENHNPWW